MLRIGAILYICSVPENMKILNVVLVIIWGIVGPAGGGVVGQTQAVQTTCQHHSSFTTFHFNATMIKKIKKISGGFFGFEKKKTRERKN